MSQPASGGKGGGQAVPTATIPTANIPRGAMMPGTNMAEYQTQVQPAAGSKGGGQQQNIFDQSNRWLRNSALRMHQGMDYTPVSVTGAAARGYTAPTTGWGYDPALSNTAITPSSYQAAQAAGGVQGNSYDAALMRNQPIDDYMNPFTREVVEQSLADIERSRQMASNTADAQATSAGAFGGSRQALMQSENNRNFLDQAARTASGLNMQGFRDAQQMALADAAAQNQAGQFNASQGMQAALANLQNRQFNTTAQNQASQFNLGQDMQSQLANLQNDQFNVGNQNQASQFARASSLQAALDNARNQTQASISSASNATSAAQANANAANQAAQLRANSANNLAQLSNLGFNQGMTILGQQSQQGNVLRGIEQGLINAAMGQFDGYRQQPYQDASIMAQLLGSLPIPQSESSTSTPGLLDIGTTLGTAALSAGVFPSDMRLKENIAPTGRYIKGIPTYTWTWSEEALSSGIPLGPESGVLAQEVAQIKPNAVTRHELGYLMVNYGEL